jgi:hypothetical protein
MVTAKQPAITQETNDDLTVFEQLKIKFNIVSRM